MSANNWGFCPKCKEDSAKRIATAIKDAEALYGKVPAAEYTAKMQSAQAKQKDDLEETLREDWEIGVSDNFMFRVWYGCSCTACGFIFEFERKFDTRKPTP